MSDLAKTIMAFIQLVESRADVLEWYDTCGGESAALDEIETFIREDPRALFDYVNENKAAAGKAGADIVAKAIDGLKKLMV